jgi:DNA-binding transcriptional regulator YhcF (GntR family)
MAALRPESFQLALQSLRAQLREGVFAPGARITATEIAAELSLSPTPVREALAWLAGERIVEVRRGQGFFIRQLTASDIADLYRLSLAHLLIAQDPDRPQLARRQPIESADFPDPAADPVVVVERLFAAWIAEGAGRVLAGAHLIVQTQLGPVRRIERLIIPNLAAEAQALDATSARGAAGDRLNRLRHFHARRVRVADRLASLLTRGGGAPENSGDIV